MEKKETSTHIVEELGTKGILFILLGLLGLGMMITKCTTAMFTPSKETLMYERFTNKIRKEFKLPDTIKIEFGERDSTQTYTQGLYGREWTVNAWVYARWLDPETSTWQPIKCSVNGGLGITYDDMFVYACEKVDHFRYKE